jgi:hypothetical protein
MQKMTRTEATRPTDGLTVDLLLPETESRDSSPFNPPIDSGSGQFIEAQLISARVRGIIEQLDALSSLKHKIEFEQLRKVNRRPDTDGGEISYSQLVAKRRMLHDRIASLRRKCDNLDNGIAETRSKLSSLVHTGVRGRSPCEQTVKELEAECVAMEIRIQIALNFLHNGSKSSIT